jgi:hypothetical protein
MRKFLAPLIAGTYIAEIKMHIVCGNYYIVREFRVNPSKGVRVMKKFAVMCGFLIIFLMPMADGAGTHSGPGGLFAASAGAQSLQSYFGPQSWINMTTLKKRFVGKPDPLPGSDYVILGWNDLGMHCINPSFAEIGMLPPFNNLWVQVIKRGDPPQIVTSGITLQYYVANNTTSSGKTDFWQYARQLFGVSLSSGIGLTGNGLSGTMQVVGDHFEATGIPVTPYDDEMNWNPFQMAVVTLKETRPKGIKKGQSIQVVLPVSDEINCAQCHAQGMDGTINLPNGGGDSVFGNILLVHDYYNGKNGISSTGQNIAGTGKSVLCAQCHSSNALGSLGKGDGTSKSVSLAMHGWHNGVDRAPDATCYSCHPGEATQCLRTAIGGMGYQGTEPSCQTGLCHGGMKGVIDSAAAGRRPWLDEPDRANSNCALCHGSNYSTGGNLYRSSKGHGGVYCAACHNSPHAWWPSKLWADNMVPMKTQRSSYSIERCDTCHTTKKQGDNPHATYYPGYGR